MNTQPLDYKDGDLQCQGYLATPDTAGPRPGILVFHEAPGLGPGPKRRAAMLAEELGVFALAADMYGGGADPQTGPAAMTRARPLLEDRTVMRGRALAALAALEGVPGVDRDRIAAIGYCFGGATVLELARAGTDIRGVVAFHGNLKTSMPAEEGAIRTKVLICTGELDPSIPLEDRNAIQDELSRGGADWQMVVYSGAKHGFTNPQAPAIEGFGYQEAADQRSWRHMKDFFVEVLA